MKTAVNSLFAILLGLAAVNTATTRVARADSDAAYYQQFLYAETTNADDQVSTRFLMSTYSTGSPGFDVGTNEQGIAVKGDFLLFLLKDGTFVVKYMETNAQGAPISFPMFNRFDGTWSVPADKLLVGDLAEGTRGVYESRNAVQLTFLKDLKTPGLKGKTVILDYGFSNEKPNDP